MKQYIKSLLSGEVGEAPGRVLFFLSIAVTAVSLIASCSKNDDDGVFDKVWKQKNEEAFAAIAKNPGYKELKSLSNYGSIYYKVLKKGEDGAKRVYYNSRAQVYYKGFYVAAHENIKAGDVFDQRLFEDGIPFNVALSAAVSNQSTTNPNGYATTITGWTDVLQHMVEGDKWEVWIPYQLGYGQYDVYNSGKLTMKGSTTLAFEIELVKAIDLNEF
ncbi:MAG: FKBP-type peptidyl-prolyl cis-trans isomerase [Tannerella sp.]|jgi:peptidylprolyl isomerase/FKBP-type peptidyl-prolyl cis-trans isomerase FklB|nr:FKBP-type peptidyl-prolyl cis-trans isomerase [Tannerella sp.]